MIPTTLLWLLLALGSSFGGCVLLALAQAKHCSLVSGGYLAIAPAARLKRTVGTALLLLALFCCISQNGASFGLPLFLFLLGSTALLTALLLAIRPYWLRLFV
jgi:hypothetical protein